MKKLKLKKGRRKTLLFTIMFIFAVLTFSGLYMLLDKSDNILDTNAKYVLGDEQPIPLYDENFKKIKDIYRGTKINSYDKKITDNKNNNYVKINYNGQILYINETNLTNDETNLITEKNVYVRTSATLYKNAETGEILSLAKKGDELQVLGYDKIVADGKVNIYKVKLGEVEGYIYKKYVLLSKEEASKNYEPEKYYNIHNNRGNRFSGGHAGNLDYYPVAKGSFKDNVMPSKVYALYLNGGRNSISNIDAYIEYAKTTKINAFVVDIFDDTLGYKSKVSEQFSPTNYKYANNSMESYKNAITKIKNAGFYVIGRITAFKDKNYCLDHPDDAILNTQTGEPYLHDNTYWPSPFQRSVWEFKVNLAKEAVIEMGFDEIQFDYARFPDRTGDAEKSGIMDFRNEYGEEKAQAIQRFLMYATDEIHKINAYISVDVFGESAYTYVTAYGQYWAALSNVVDVISGMPYPDHFNKYEFGFKEPVWTTPYELLNHWASKYVAIRQQEIPTPAIARTWVQVSDVPSYKHPGGYLYGVPQIDAQIRGIFDAGLTGGYMTWLSSSNLERYKSQKEVYDKEY